LLWIIIPISLFISIIYSYSKLSSDTELVIFKASGISNYDIMRPALTFSILCTCVSFLIAFYLLPSSYREFKDMQSFIKNNYASIFLQEGVFSKPSNDLTIYIKEKDDNNIFNKLLVHDSRNKDKTVTITAQKGFLDQSSSEPVFILKNGSHQEMNRETKATSLLYFEQYNLKLGSFKDNLQITRNRQPKEMFLAELLFPKEDISNSEYKKIISELNNRVTWPFYNILLCLIALIPFLKVEFNRMGNIKPIVASSVIALVVIISTLSVKSLSEKNQIFTLVNYFLIIGGIGFFYVYLTNNRAGSSKK